QRIESQVARGPIIKLAWRYHRFQSQFHWDGMAVGCAHLSIDQFKTFLVGFCDDVLKLARGDPFKAFLHRSKKLAQGHKSLAVKLKRILLGIMTQQKTQKARDALRCDHDRSPPCAATSRPWLSLPPFVPRSVRRYGTQSRWPRSRPSRSPG